MRTKLLFAAVAGATALLAGQASAAVVLSDNFNSDTLMLDWPGDSVFTSSGPNIFGGPSTDLIGAPNFYNFLLNHGRYVDLDGSTGSGHNPAGVLTSNSVFAAGDYTLTFDLAGNQRGWFSQATTISLGSWSTTITPVNTDPFITHTFKFHTTGGRLVFFEHGPSDQQGNLLDNVQLSTAPEPQSWALMLMGFGGLGGLLRARRRTAAALA